MMASWLAVFVEQVGATSQLVIHVIARPCSAVGVGLEVGLAEGADEVSFEATGDAIVNEDSHVVLDWLHDAGREGGD